VNRAGVAAAILALCSACSPAAGNTPPVVAMRSRDDFVPGRISVNAGEHVIWSNEDSIRHVVAVDGTSTTLEINPGDVGETTFATPGTFLVRDPDHPEMLATVAVAPSGGG
jgi:plastocyanin